MKFGFDKNTGIYGPKKDENIYFGGSQGGGIIVDDKKNKVRYIIEKDGTITWLFSTRKDLHLYDMRDGKMIADRVMRKFGSGHKYSDFRYFVKNMRGADECIIPTFKDFVNEALGDKMYFKCTCADVTQEEWDELMKGRKPINYDILVNKVRKDCPNLYKKLHLELNNPYKNDCYETDEYYVLTHSCTNYFFKKSE